MTSEHAGFTSTLRALVAWARQADAISGALLVGSRAALGGRVDALSDYDVLLFVDDEAGYAQTDDWLETFGSILVMVHDQYELLGRKVPTRLVQYADGSRIDFSLCSLDLLDGLVAEPKLPPMLEAGYRILVDERGLLSDLAPASGRAYLPARPGEAEYRHVVNEFWWETTCAAKHLARGEVLPASYNADCVLRFQCLIPMLEWHIATAPAETKPLGPFGRGLADRLDAEERALLDRTFAGASLEERWSALFAMTELFTRVASDVANELGFPADDTLGPKVQRFLRETSNRGPID